MAKFDETQRNIWADAYHYCEKWNARCLEPKDWDEAARELGEIVGKKYENDQLATELFIGVYGYLEWQWHVWHDAQQADGVETVEPEPEPEQIVLDF